MPSREGRLKDQNQVLGIMKVWPNVIQKTGALIILVASIYGCPNARAVSPDDWQRLSDGRVVIEVKDVRIALPQRGPNAEAIRFAGTNFKNTMTLQKAVEAPATARRLFQSTSIVSVDLTSLLAMQSSFLGKFQLSKVESVSVSVAVGQNAVNGCQSWAEIFSRLADIVAHDNRPLSASGWAEFKLSERPLALGYVRSPLDSEQAFFPGVSCNYFKRCSATKCLSPDVVASYRFNGSRVGQQDWLALDRTMYQILAYVFIDLEIDKDTK
jgi:hypothetical protein